MPLFINKVTIGLAVLVLAILSFVYIQANPDLLKQIDTPGPDISEEMVLVSDQEVISDSITIDQAVIKNPKGGFIVIFKERTDGSIEGHVGSTEYLASGAYENLKVTFYPEEQRNNITVASLDTLRATFIVDDGDKIYNEPDQFSAVSDTFKVL